MRALLPYGCILGGSLALSVLWACAASLDPARVSGPDPAGSGSPAGDDDTGDDDESSSSGGDNGDVLDVFASDVTYAADITFEGTNGAHAAAGGADAGAPTAAANPDCLSCHGQGKAGADTKFATGGYVLEKKAATDAGADTPCAACEVLFVDSTGHRARVKTASDGTFAFRVDEYGTVSAGTHVGVRRDPLESLMPIEQSIDSGGKLLGCNSAQCHKPAGSEEPIVLGAQ